MCNISVSYSSEIALNCSGASTNRPRISFASWSTAIKSPTLVTKAHCDCKCGDVNIVWKRKLDSRKRLLHLHLRVAFLRWVGRYSAHHVNTSDLHARFPIRNSHTKAFYEMLQLFKSWIFGNIVLYVSRILVTLTT